MADLSASHPDRPVEPHPHGRPEGRYSTGQIVAHWTVVAFVICQYLTGEAQSAAFAQALDFGRLPAEGVLFVHGFFGTIIFAAMVWRLGLRYRYGAPPPPDTLSAPLQMVSRWVHYAFYALLLGMPLFGMAALWLKIGIFGTLHAWASWLVLVLAIAHVAGAAFHIYKRDGTISRVLRGNSVP